MMQSVSLKRVGDLFRFSSARGISREYEWESTEYNWKCGWKWKSPLDLADYVDSHNIFLTIHFCSDPFSGSVAIPKYAWNNDYVSRARNETLSMSA